MSKGKNHVIICTDNECKDHGADTIVDRFASVLNIEPGETSADGRFSTNCHGCIRACGLAPVVMVGEKTYGKVSPDMVHEMIRECDDR